MISARPAGPTARLNCAAFWPIQTFLSIRTDANTNIRKKKSAYLVRELEPGTETGFLDDLPLAAGVPPEAAPATRLRWFCWLIAVVTITDSSSMRFDRAARVTSEI